jgi:hypothetical protein
MTIDGLQEVLNLLVEDWNKAVDASPPLFERIHRSAQQQTQAGE